MSDADVLSRRSILLGGVAALAVAGIAGQTLIDGGPLGNFTNDVSAPINDNGAITSVVLQGDVSIPITSPYSVSVPMQTNGTLLKVVTDGSSGAFDLSKIILDVVDRGHDTEGNEVDQARSIGIRDFLRGPFNQTNYYSPLPATYFMVLDDRVFRLDDVWQTRIVAIRFLEGWLAGKAPEVIIGAAVGREDSLAYLPFPVKTPTWPFQRIGTGESLTFEVSGLNDFARNGSPFACVEAWTWVAGVAGSIVRTSQISRSPQTPEGATPSGLPAPTYAMTLDGIGIPDGQGEIRYRVCPWIGPSWLSTDLGESYPTPNAPQGLPFLADAAGNYAPIFGIVGQDGSGLAGTSVLGLARTIDAALASGQVYKDIAAVAAAVRKFNASLLPIQIADGLARRMVRHDDIAGGVAVLRAIGGSQLGQNAGSYAMRTAFSSTATYPIGPTYFEIRSDTGLASDSVRLRGVLPNGVAVAAGVKGVTPRLLLRGITLDGTNSATTQNIIIDGTAAAGAATIKPTLASCAYLVRMDCRVLENPAAGTANAACYRAGYVWDIRADCQGISGLGSLCASPAVFSALVASIGSRYSKPTQGSALSPTCLLGISSENVPITGQSLGIQPTFTGQLLINVLASYTVAFTSPIIGLAASRPVVGGLGLCNVFAKGSVDSGGPLIQIGADGTRLEFDNAIIRHVGHCLVSATKQTNGRANLFYQDQGFTRVNKIGSIRFSAFNCFTIKGDTFPATEVISASNTSTEKTWVASKLYYKGSIVWDTAGGATVASRFYQALTDIAVAAPEQVALTDPTRWLDLGLIFGKAYGAQPLRQGNLAIRYQIGCLGNVAAVSYNGETTPSPTSGYGLAWGKDSKTAANFQDYYIDPAGGDFHPKSIAGGALVNGPLLDRVPQGLACIPFDLFGTARRDDGSGSAGAYERA